MSKTSIEIGGKEITLETGSLARQAGGAVVVKMGDTTVLVTAAASKDPRENVDFLPLSVDVEERMYAAGKIPGGFYKREGRPSEASILTARLTDRPLRPNFPDGFRHDVQIISTIFSVDQVHQPDILTILGASAALTISNIPFGEPIGAVRIGRINGEWVINPTFQELNESDLDLIVAGKKGSITMVEAGAESIPEELIVESFQVAQKEIDRLVDMQLQWQKEVGKEKFAITPKTETAGLREDIERFAVDDIKSAMKIIEKAERETALSNTIDKVLEHLSEKYEDNIGEIKPIFKNLVKQEARNLVLNEQVRMDGRKPDEIRPITIETGILPRTHGTGLFTRGQTQVLTILTLGALGEEQMIDGLGVEVSKRFMHHYNFPPFCTGEAGRMVGPKRREIGHGALVERAISPIIPEEEPFPYTVRLVSEVLESNGSSSMASVCGSTLALMDAGVPIKAPVAGIAMGLITGENNSVILTDILGAEDALGDMDFKVAGTQEGITALQMDIKVEGLSLQQLTEALDRARQARLFILDKITQAIQKPREEMSPYAPRVISMRIPTDKIGMVIGPGGKMIRAIIEETGANIDIEDDGLIYITGKSGPAAEQAKKKIESITKDVEVGEIYEGTVVKTTSFGAFVQIIPGKDGLLHISKLGQKNVQRVEDVINVGDKVLVEVTEIDRQNRINLTAKEIKPKNEQSNE